MRRRMLLGGKKRPFNINDYNTFIGKAGQTYDTAQKLADVFLTPFTVSDIKRFFVDGDGNIFCKIDVNYAIDVNAFSVPQGFPSGGITYYIDIEDRCEGLRSGIFTGQTSLGKILLKNWNQVGAGGAQFQNCTGWNFYAYFPSLVTINNQCLHTAAKRIYIPVATNISTSTNHNAIRPPSNGFIYANPSLETSNGGNLHTMLQWCVDNRNSTIVFVSDTTPPSAVTDLSASNIGTTTLDLDFTAPSSTNGIGYYNVWVDDLTNNPIKLFVPYQEIAASGGTVTGLVSGTTYKIKIKAYTTMGTEAVDFSNEIEATTL